MSRDAFTSSVARAAAIMTRAMSTLVVVASVAWLTLLAHCESTRSESGFGEPLRVRNGVFKEGALPGTPPVPSDQAPRGLAITAIETASTVLRPGQGEKTLGGRASVGTTAVAITMAGFGRGYWVVGVDGPDPLNGGELGWQALVEVAHDAPIGPKDLLLVAIDAAGNAGTQRALPICVPRVVPDNLNACNQQTPPPAAVVSLSWDEPVDLDLVVVAPDGTVIDAKHPRGRSPKGAGASDGGADAATASAAPFLDRDSNAACTLDRVQQEDLVFPDAPAPGAGSYVVFVNMFDACGGRTPAHFRVTVHTRAQVAGSASASELIETDSRAGVLTAVDANGGRSLGTFVLEATF